MTPEMKAVLKSLGMSDAEIAAVEAQSAAANKPATSTKSTKPTSVSYPSVYSKTQANAKISDIFQKLLDRDATTAELNAWRPKLIAAQKEFAAKQTYKRTGKTAAQATVGGLDEDYWLTTELTGDATLGPEIKRLSTLDPKVRQKEQNKREYEAAIKAVADNPTAQAALDQNTAYGIDIRNIKDAISTQADAAGAAIDENTLLQLAQEAYDTNQDQSQASLYKFINRKLKVAPIGGQYKGEAATNYEKLLEVGIDNGINIETDPRFKGQVSNWLTQVAAGAPLQNFEALIRNAAGENQPAFVKSLLKSGQDLRGIYGNYTKRMATFFDVDQDSIDLNDPLLKSVFTDKGGITFKQFDEQLTKDSRFTGAEKGNKLNNRQYIVDRALTLGVQLTDVDIDEILNTAFNLDLSTNAPEIDKLIRSKFNYTPGKAFGGEAGQTIIGLRQTAAANGIDLDAQFGGQLDTWVEKVMQGESVETFKSLIRQTAKIGLPENVGKLLDEGVDLDTIYTPYRNIMSKVLEINPETIRLDDPVLRSAITSQGEMSIYDYQRSLRKDARWQYTDNARQEVSNSVLGVLRDFGFQG